MTQDTTTTRGWAFGLALLLPVACGSSSEDTSTGMGLPDPMGSSSGDGDGLSDSSTVFDHHMQRVTLATGVTLEISAIHPTADGRTFDDLNAQGMLDGIDVLSVETIEYQHDFTYDVLPDSDTGAYFAGGVLIGSTLWPQP